MNNNTVNTIKHFNLKESINNIYYIKHFNFKHDIGYINGWDNVIANPIICEEKLRSPFFFPFTFLS